MTASRVVLLLAALCCSAALASGQQFEGQPVTDVVLEGDVGVSHDLIRANLRTRAGRAYSAALVDEDTRWLADRHGVLAEVTIEEGPVVRFRLLRVRRFASLEFAGNDNNSSSQLTTIAGLASLTGVTPDDAIAGRDLVRDHYLRNGYAFVQVDLETAAVPGSADQEAVLRVWEGPQVETADIRIEGLTALDEDAVKSVMRSAPGLFDLLLGKDFVRSELDADVVLIEGFVRGEGYLDARVALSRLEFTDDRSEVVVHIYVDQGERYTVRAMRVEGAEAISADALLQTAALRVGGPYRRPDVVRTLRRMQDLYGHEGFIDVRITPEEVFDETGSFLDVVWRVEEGGQKRVRDVLVRGNVGTRDSVIRRYSTLYPGDVVDTRELDYTEDALISLDAFSDLTGRPQVVVDTVETPDPDLVDVMIDVGDNQSGLFSFLVGAGSDSGLFGGVAIDKRNFDARRAASSWGDFVDEFFRTGEAFHGGGQRLFFEVVPGTETTNVDITFQDPWLDETREDPWGVSASLFRRERIFDDYDRDATGLSVLFDHDISRETTISVGGKIEETDISDVDKKEVPTIFMDEGSHTSIGPEAGLRYRKLDSLLEPTEGIDASVRVENMGLLGGDIDANRIIVSGEWFEPLHETESGKMAVLHPRLTVGAVDPTGSDKDFPFFENFFAGGSSGPFAVRGFDYQGVGPHESDTALGGRLAAVGSVEALLPLVTQYNPYRDEEETILKGVLFLDVANVVPKVAFGDLTSNLRASVGGGVRVRLPALGGVTLSLDLGIPIAKESGDQTRAISFELTRRF